MKSLITLLVAATAAIATAHAWAAHEPESLNVGSLQKTEKIVR